MKKLAQLTYSPNDFMPRGNRLLSATNSLRDPRVFSNQQSSTFIYSYPTSAYPSDTTKSAIVRNKFSLKIRIEREKD